MLQKFINSRNLEKSTIKSYKTVISQYEKFHNETIEDLIVEAWNDEEEYQNIYQRRINNRIMDFRTALIETENLATNTINLKIMKLQTFYTHYGVTFPKVKGLKDKSKQLTYYDLPNKKQISMACESTSIQNQAIILFIASSGTGRTECANLTIKDFVMATEEYHEGGTLEEILDTLWATDEPLVPTFSVMRQKTSKQYYTFCTPEATFSIIRWLKHRLKILEQKNNRNQTNEKLDWNDSLFGTTARGIGDRFNVINDNLEFGFKGKSRFFRPHTLRKFHASNIGLSEEHIDMIQGRSKDKVHETYIKTNPAYLKKVYMTAMDNVTINLEGQRTVHNEEYNINIHLHFHNEQMSTSLF